MVDRILVMPIIKKPLNIGDIIVYHKFQEHLTVHRILNIVKLSETRFYCETKGDNNLEIDPYKVLSHEIIGVVDYERRMKMSLLNLYIGIITKNCNLSANIAIMPKNILTINQVHIWQTK